MNEINYLIRLSSREKEARMLPNWGSLNVAVNAADVMMRVFDYETAEIWRFHKMELVAILTRDDK